MKNIFRTVEFWKSAVMTMPDNSFFELLRSVFGKIKTPFKKQQLLRDLEIFLSREDIQKTITEYIDENDEKIITAVALFGEPVPGELESFFLGEFSYAQIQDMTVNLEERFILYRFKEDNVNHIALNPVLEQALVPVIQNVSVLFPGVTKNDDAAVSAASAVILNDRILAGLFSFVSQWDSFFKSENVIRKQVIEAGKNCFPGLDLYLLYGSLQILGLFYTETDRLAPDKKCFDDFCLLSARERMEYCAAALIVYEEINSGKTAGQTEILPPLFRNRIREISGFIHTFSDSLDTGALYTDNTLRRLLQLLKSKTNIKINETLLDTMLKTGLLSAVSPELKQPGSFLNDQVKKSEKPFITIDSGFSVLVYPEINFSDAIAIASFLNIKETGAVVRFELEKDSAVRAFNNFATAENILELLSGLSGGRIDENLVWNLKEWEKRHGEVSLKKGVVLTLSQDKLYLADTQPLSGMINEMLAPGVFLLGENTVEEASSALYNAGIDIISLRSGKKPQNAIRKQFPSLSPVFETFNISACSQPVKKKGVSHHFHEVLEKMQLDKTIQIELSARINRRLILCETQLKQADIRYEKLEARHMDYSGKQIIAKQAVSQHSPVEIIWPQAGKENNIFGIPKSLEKENGELILVVSSDNNEVIRIPLAKISFLRRIKKSIFEP